jgi:hypothetical protein
MIGTDPGLRFWLSYVEHHGGLVDDVPAGALAMLPEPLQAQLGLPETVTVTADPETAREDGALLLAAGHPVLDLAAEAVLTAGDVGRQALAWPSDVMPAGADLLEQARDTIPVDHGRIDLAAAPIRSYLPVLRAGALVRYVVAGDEAFQERAECWLDTDTRRELLDVHRQALESSLPCAPDTTQVLPFELGSAVEAVHQVLTARADARLAALDDDGKAARAAEITRTKAYYREVLDGIERRRANTAPDRLAALDTRAEATRAEQARRLQEIREKHQARFELTPYRLQLVLVPVVVLLVDVMRGSRRYPQRLVWVWPARQFRPLTCPSCGSDSPLVASKSELGCRSCLTKPAAPPPSPSAQSTRTPEAKPVAGKPLRTPEVRPAPAGPVSLPRSAPPAKPVSPAKPAVPSAARVTSIGDDLFVAFWQAVAEGDRNLSKKFLANSPATTAVRLFGVRWLGCAVGLAPSSSLLRVGGRTRHPSADERFVTEGWVETHEHRGVRFPAAVVWRLVGGKPVVDEIVPHAANDPNLLVRGWFLSPGDVVLDRLPVRGVVLDAVAARLTDVVLPVEGLPLLIRCLTAWWRLAPELTTAAGHPPEVISAALLRLISWRSGDRVATAESARRFRVNVAQIKSAESQLKTRLQLSADVVW